MDRVIHWGSQPTDILAYVKPNEKHRQDLIRHIEDLHVAVGIAAGVPVIPVRPAFEEASQRRPDLPLHMPHDGTHPSVAGTCLAAAPVFGSLYGRSPAGNPHDCYGKVDATAGRLLQELAEDAVRALFGREGSRAHASVRAELSGDRSPRKPAMSFGAAPAAAAIHHLEHKYESAKSRSGRLVPTPCPDR